MDRSTISITYDAEKPKISPALFKFSQGRQWCKERIGKISEGGDR
jgi:hypothetical protein